MANLSLASKISRHWPVDVYVNWFLTGDSTKDLFLPLISSILKKSKNLHALDFDGGQGVKAPIFYSCPSGGLRPDGVEAMRPSGDPDLNIQGVGPTLGAAFGQAALAMISAITDPAAVKLEETIEIDRTAPSAELLLVDWLNAVVSEMAVRGMVFGAFEVDTDGFQLHAAATGEHVSQERHRPGIQIKGATLKGLSVRENPPGEWRVQCSVDFSRT